MSHQSIGIESPFVCFVRKISVAYHVDDRQLQLPGNVALAKPPLTKHERMYFNFLDDFIHRPYFSVDAQERRAVKRGEFVFHIAE